MGHSDTKFWFSGNAHTGKPWFTWCILSFKKTADAIFKLSFLISAIERYRFFVGQPNHSLLCNESENGKCTSNHSRTWNARKKLISYFVTLKRFVYREEWIEIILAVR